MIGTVKFFNSAKGFGFIAPEGGGKDVFVHANAIKASDLGKIAEGDRLAFEIIDEKRGPKAANLRRAP